MNNKIKIITLIIFIFTLSGCTLPLQSTKYPAWNTKGILESYTLTDGRVVDGWMGTEIGNKVSAKWYDFTVNSVDFVNDYEGYSASDGNILVHASITITNTSEKTIYLFDGDFALVWDLDKDERSYAYSKEAYTDTMLTNEYAINVGETKTIDTIYEISKNNKKPMAIYYYEQYSDGQKGNKYYIYIK
jgi:hypothetical protein